MSGHTCHALFCEVNVPQRMHMCLTHWRMVPSDKQRRLWATYRRGQERDMSPSAAYLRAAAACVRAVAEKEGHAEDDIAHECSLYLDWAKMVEEET